MALSPLTTEQILAWADAHHERTGEWPRKTSGAIIGAPGETWFAIDASLFLGHRELVRGSSLPRLLAEHRGIRNYAEPPRLSVEQILIWADAHKARTGEWPITKDLIPDKPDETWAAVDASLQAGLRGLPGGGFTDAVSGPTSGQAEQGPILPRLDHEANQGLDAGASRADGKVATTDLWDDPRSYWGNVGGRLRGT